MTSPLIAHRAYRLLKLILFILLTFNAIHYALGDEAGTAMDSIAWLVLLVLFELEAGYGAHLRAHRLLKLVLLLRYAAGAMLAVAAWQYGLSEDWLDLANALLWMGVVVMLEAQLRWPGLAARWQGVTLGVVITLYGGLLAMVALWVAEADWFSVYDAALWLMAFAVLERDVLKLRQVSFEWDE